MNIQGLLSDPMLQIGMGILANNTGHRGAFAPALGQGVMQGMNNVAQYQQMQQMNEFRKQQQELHAQQIKAQQARLQQEAQEQEAIQGAINEAIKMRPDLAPVFKIDPKAALKIAYPQMSSADPYYTPIATENGLGSFDNRSGTFTPLNISGKPIIKSTDSPLVRGAVKGAESQAAANWKPNTDIDGQVLTDAQVSQMARGGFNTPYPLTWNGQPMGAEGTTLTDRQEGINSPADIRVGNPATPNRGGIRVPTKADQAAAVKRAEMDVTTKVDAEKNVKKANQFLEVANQAKSILFNTKNPPTASGIGAVVDSAAGLVGYAPQGASEASRLDALSGWLVSNVPRMEGPQSNFDVQNYQTMAGLIGDRAKPLNVRQGALNEVIRLQEKYKALNEGDSNIMPKTEKMPNVFDAMPKPSQYKGKVLRDDVTGKRYQSDGLKWKEIK